jgi:uncharacterized membrane protein (DUF373 family)
MDASGLLKTYEKIVYGILIVLFAVIVAFALGELTLLLIDFLLVSTPLLLVDNELLELIGYFLLVLIAVEILATISVYIKENVIHVETVMIVAIIAVARSVILFEPSAGGMNAINMLGIAAIILALCAGYYLLKKAGLNGV